MPRSSPTSHQNVAKGPRDTCRLAVASGSKAVPHLQTVHPGGTPFPSPAAGTTFSKISCPQKGYSLPRGQGPADISPRPAWGPISTATSPAPGGAIEPHFCWDEQQDKVKRQIQSLPGLTLMATKLPQGPPKSPEYPRLEGWLSCTWPLLGCPGASPELATVLLLKVVTWNRPIPGPETKRRSAAATHK